MPKRSIGSEIWSDSWFESLKPNDKLLFFYLLTNERTNMLGIYEVSIKKISFETGLTEEAIIKGFEGFAKGSKVYYTEDNYVVIRNFLKHQNFNDNMKKSALSIYKSLPDSLKNGDLDLNNLTLNEGFETLCKEFGIFNIIEYKFKEKDKGNTPAPTVSLNPSLEEVTLYFNEKGYNDKHAKKAFDYYNDADWIDSKGNKVRNWKQKMISVWHKDEGLLRPGDGEDNPLSPEAIKKRQEDSDKQLQKDKGL